MKSARMLLLILVLLAAVLVGCQAAADRGIDISERTIEEIEAYLEPRSSQSAPGGRVFCACEVLGSAQQGEQLTVYLWALCQEYYVESGSLARGTGSSCPVAVVLQSEGGRLQIVEHRIPGDGANYRNDIRVIFPRSVRSKIVPETPEEVNNMNNRVKKLEAEAKDKAETFFEEKPPELLRLHSARVELDIFSGRPNPIWMLSEEQVTELQTRLESLPEVTTSVPVEGKLGYRGFVIGDEPWKQNSTDRVRVFHGFVEINSGSKIIRLLDRDNRVEQWFLLTAKPNIDASLYDYLQKEILGEANNVLFPRQPPVQGERITMTALLIGTLVESEGCLRVNVDEGHMSYLPVWPPDFTSRIRDGRIEIMDGSGQVLVRVGDVVSMGGGEDQTGSSLDERLRQELPGRCAGPYWIVGEGVRRVEPK